MLTEEMLPWITECSETRHVFSPHVHVAPTVVQRSCQRVVGHQAGGLCYLVPLSDVPATSPSSVATLVAVGAVCGVRATVTSSVELVTSRQMEAILKYDYCSKSATDAHVSAECITQASVYLSGSKGGRPARHRVHRGRPAHLCFVRLTL